MKKFAAVGLIPLFAGFLCAQETRTTETHTTTTRTWNGTLVDAGCRSTHTEHKETTSTTNPDERTTTTKTETSHSEMMDCPVTTTTTSFGLLTADGRYIQFDQPSNTKIVEVVKSNRDWNRDLMDRKPIRVTVVGASNGDVAMMESMRPVTTVGEASRVVGPPDSSDTETILDATYNGDNGKLIIGPDRISWQDLAHANRSRTWNYSEIKELKRDNGDNAVKIQPYNGGEHKFKVQGPLMNDTVYNMIADRIIAARPH